jgi:hypothetical protein
MLLPLLWTRSTRRIMFPRSPHRAGPRHGLAVVQKPSEHRRSKPSGRITSEPRRNPRPPRWVPSPLNLGRSIEIQWIWSIHLTKWYRVISCVQSSFNPTLHNGDPNEPVSTNQTQPRVSFWFKPNSK